MMLRLIQCSMENEMTRVQTGFSKGQVTPNVIADVCCIIEKAKEYHKKKPACASLITERSIVSIILSILSYRKMGLSEHLIALGKKLCFCIEHSEMYWLHIG